MKLSVLLPELLPFIMQTESFNQHSVKQSKGSVNPYVNFSDLAWYEFHLPPLPEQRRIAEVLLRADVTTESYLHLSEKLRVVALAVVESLLADGDKGEVRLLSELANINYGLTVNRQRRTAPNRVPYLRVANVLRDSLDLSEVKDIGIIDGDEQHMLRPGDVLVVEGHASRDQIGRAAIWRDEIGECVHQNHLIRVRCSERLNPEYLNIVINSLRGRRHFQSHAKSTSGLNTINSSVVGALEVPVLSLGNQERIVSMLSTVNALLEEISLRLATMSSLKAGLLQSATISK